MGEKTQRDPTGTKMTIPSDAAMRCARERASGTDSAVA